MEVATVRKEAAMKFNSYIDLLNPDGYEMTEEGALCYTLESVYRSALNRPLNPYGYKIGGLTQGFQVSFEVFRCAQEAGADMDKFKELFVDVFGLIGAVGVH